METLINKMEKETAENGRYVTVESLSKDYPLTIKPTHEFNSEHWAKENKDWLNELLRIHGAILLRGFKIEEAKGFNKMFSAIAGDAMAYTNRTSPRDQVHQNVYTSTNHPKDQLIHMHTENSYSKKFNRIIAFYCLTSPNKGGETPIADERKLLEFLKPETLLKFREKKIQYLRNSIPGVGLDWKTIYQTDQKDAVNQQLELSGVDFKWVDDDHLRVKWVLPAIQNHPITGEEMWFNHMYFGLKSHYDPIVLEYFAAEDLPFATYYGDGSEIEDSVVQEFQDFYQKNSIIFKWQKDDFLLLDNMMFSHGRMPYQGDRTILTAMAQQYAFSS